MRHFSDGELRPRHRVRHVATALNRPPSCRNTAHWRGGRHTIAPESSGARLGVVEEGKSGEVAMRSESDNGDENVNGLQSVVDYFDVQYKSEMHYWWRQDVRYATDPDSFPFSLLTQMTLRLIAEQRPGRALDLGAGEGADSIRLALLGYSVDSVEISNVGAMKILRFAADAGVTVNVQVADVNDYEPAGQFDLVICNGLLHYIENKAPVIGRIQDATRPGGLNVVSLWSTYTQVPPCHAIVPVFCDPEDGVVMGSYRHWMKKLVYFERDKTESSHSGPSHSHSHIKMIARKPD